MKLRKTVAFVLAGCLAFSMVACGAQPTPNAESKPKESSEQSKSPAEVVEEEKPEIHPWLNETLKMEDMDPVGGADSAEHTFDHADSIYFARPDFYNMKSNDHLTILEQFETCQQTCEWSCGDCALLMALHYLGVDNYTEYELCKATKTSTDEDVEGAEPGSFNNWYELGANLEKLMNFLETCPEVKVVETNYKKDYTEEDLVGEKDIVPPLYSPYMEGNLKKYFDPNALYTTDNDPASENWVEDAAQSYFVKWVKGHLEAGEPIVVHTSSWNGHFSVLIGYDSMGTPTIGDDMLIFADSYDTADHWQDGYVYCNLQKWFFEWDDLNVACKPYQLQPFIVLGKAD